MERLPHEETPIRPRRRSGTALCRLVGIVLLCSAITPMAAQACSIGTNSITTTTNLNFGGIFTGAAGTVTVPPVGARTASGAILATTSQFSQGAAAALSVCSARDTTAYVTLPADGTVFLTGPGSSMAVNGFAANPTASSSSPMTVFGSSAVTLNVGATLTVSSTQTAGSYSGSFSITINYN